MNLDRRLLSRHWMTFATGLMLLTATACNFSSPRKTVERNTNVQTSGGPKKPEPELDGGRYCVETMTLNPPGPSRILTKTQIKRALAACAGNVTDAAFKLHCSRMTIYRAIERIGGRSSFGILTSSERLADDPSSTLETRHSCPGARPGVGGSA